MRVSSISNKLIVENGERFEGEYYLNDNSFLSMQIESHCSKERNLASLADVFNPPVFKRQFCKATNRAVQYFQSSDVPVASECSPVYVFGEQAERLNLLVKKGDILVTGFGTIGNTRIVSAYQENTCFANNVCRIRPINDRERGYIYSFMASKYGRAQLNKNASGSVVRYIEAPGIKKTIIPQLSSDVIDKSNSLINESILLREEAITALNTAHSKIETLFSPIGQIAPSKSVSIKDIFGSQLHRFEANYHIASGKEYSQQITSSFNYKTLGELSQKIWRPDIFKRMYVTNGVPFLSGSDIMLRIPSSEKQLSRKTPNKEEFFVDEKWILVPRSGTIGEVVYTTSQHAQKLVSEHVIRIIPNDILSSGYIFAFLSSSVGKALIQRPIFGSVIQHVEPPLLEKIPIPIIEDEKMAEIGKLAETYRECWGKSAEKELEAISLIEAEIEKWNKQ